MIIFFSATGNCKYVAKRISDAIGQEIVSITDCIKLNRYDFSDDSITIISPTYFWGLPSIVSDFLKKSNIKAEYLCFISTYGTTPGASGRIADRLLKNRKLDAFYSVRMADTWTPIFDLSTPEKVGKFTKTTESDIDNIIAKIKSGYRNKKMKHSLSAFVVDLFAQPIYNNFARKTAKLSVNEKCIGCGLCSMKCPVNAIEMKEGKPVWVSGKCVMCLGCLHRCPKFAINYGNKTQKHGQYTNPNVKV